MVNSKTSKPLKSFIGTFTGAEQLRLEKNRLEAFLAAVPGEYCGFSKDGDVVYSQNFAVLLGASKIETVYDIQKALEIHHSALFETAIKNLWENGKAFSLDVQLNVQQRFLSITGTRGLALDESDYFNILWIKDITTQKSEILSLEQSSKKHAVALEEITSLLDNVSQAIWMRDSNQKIIWVNQTYAELVNDNPKNVIEKQSEIIIKPKDKDGLKSVKDLAKQALLNNDALKLNGHINIEGKRLLVEVTERPLKKGSSTVGYIKDLSTLEHLESQFSRHKAANETLLENLRTAVAIYGADQKLEFYNSAYSQLWDLEDSWLNSHPKLGDVLERLRENRRLPEQADFRNYKQGWLDMFTRLIEPRDEMMYLPDGSALRMLIIPHPLGGLMMTFEDVTSRLELESSYNTLIAVQRETLDNLAEGVAVFGGNGRLKLYNPSYAKLWDLNPEDLESEPHITKLVERMLKLFDENIRTVKRDKLINHAINRSAQIGRITLSDSKLLEFTTVSLPDGGVMVSYFDVTDNVKVEKALREKNAALETAEQLKTDFLANVSYQLRTPLNAIIGFAEILDNQYFGSLNDKQKEYSVGIQDAGNKLVHLIDDILDLSTIEAGYLDLNYDEFDVYTIFNDIYNLTKEWALKERITVRFDCNKKLGIVIADERRIKQVLLNLIRNAINFTPENGEIILSAHSMDGYYELTVTDTGIGISKIDQDRIFEPFERAHHEHRADMSTHALSRGAGLGLSLVKNIVQLHGGKINIHSIEGKGTSVSILIPKTPEIMPDFEDFLEQ